MKRYKRKHRAPATKPQQLGLIPLKTSWCAPHVGSADLAQVCRCDDGLDYAIKTNGPGVGGGTLRTAHDEHFCYRLGQMVGIPTPNHHFVELPDGSIAFGSRFEAGDQPMQWWNDVASGAIPTAEICPALSVTYAFDLFVHNTDRHAGNLLVRRQHLGHAVIAFDYSRAWTYNGFPLPSLPMAPTTNTVLVQRYLTRKIGVYVTEHSTTQVLDKLESVSVRQIKDILGDQPIKWLTDSLAKTMIKWWRDEKSNRISLIRAGIKNGSLL